MRWVRQRHPKSGSAKRRRSKLLPHQVVLRPLVTEKGMHRATRNNQYAFEVNPLAEKVDVREAVESLFNVQGVEGADAESQGQAAPLPFHATAAPRTGRRRS